MLSYPVPVSVSGAAQPNMATVFGVPLAVAVQRSVLSQGLQLPTVIRQCIDFLEERGEVDDLLFFFPNYQESKTTSLLLVNYCILFDVQLGAVKLVLWRHWCMQLRCIQWPQRTNFPAPSCIRLGPMRIMSWYPKFNGSHFGLPPSCIYGMTGLVAISCELWRIRTGPIILKQDLFCHALDCSVIFSSVAFIAFARLLENLQYSVHELLIDSHSFVISI